MADRLIIIDPGDLVTHAIACDPANPAVLERLELESAAASIHPPRCDDTELVRERERVGRAPSPEGEGEALPAHAGPPAIVGMGEGGGFFEVGAPAATREGLDALLAARPTADKLAALIRATIFALARGGDQVELVLVADPGEKADRLEEVAESLAGARPITAFSRPGAPLETRRVAIAARTVAAGTAFLEHAFAIDAFASDDAASPVLALDLGHRATRLYLLDPAAGTVDHDVIPHGGESLLEHARRHALEKGVVPADVTILREMRAGLEALTVGGLTFPVRRFFALPREDLAKAIASVAAERLRRHLERGGRWPRALLLAGGLAASCADEIAARLAERRLAIARTLVLPAGAEPKLAGALALELRAAV